MSTPKTRTPNMDRMRALYTAFQGLDDAHADAEVRAAQARDLLDEFKAAQGPGSTTKLAEQGSDVRMSGFDRNGKVLKVKTERGQQTYLLNFGWERNVWAERHEFEVIG